MVYVDSKSKSIEDIPYVGALIGLTLGLAIVVIQLFRFSKNRREWIGERRALSIVSLVSLIVFVVIMGWITCSKLSFFTNLQ